MVLDVAALPDASSEDEDDELSVDLDNPKAAKKGLGQLHISHLLEMVLQDAQTRLFFKAQSVIQSDIRYYAPQPADLMYPDKLIGTLVSATSSANGPSKEKESFSQLVRLPTLDKQETWYPPLQKTVWVLGQLHDFVNVRTSFLISST
jgi:hypothetical protein